MNVAVVLIALALHRPQTLVARVYDAALVDPVLACAVVEYESWYKVDAWHGNYDKSGKLVSTDWGLYQLNNLYHPQYRNDLYAHVRYGGALVARLEIAADGDRWKALRGYNTDPAYPARVMRVFEEIRVTTILAGGGER